MFLVTNGTLSRFRSRMLGRCIPASQRTVRVPGEDKVALPLFDIAAQMLSRRSEAMQPRQLQTLANIAGDKTFTTVFPEPMDLIAPLLDAMKKRNARATIGQSIC